MNLTDKSGFYLSSILKWTKFFYITSIISVIIVLLVGLVMIFGGFYGGDEDTVVILVTGITYLLLGGLLVFPVIYMKRILDKGNAALAKDDELELEHALLYTRSLCKFFGIYIIVAIALVIVAVLVGIVAALIGIVM